MSENHLLVQTMAEDLLRRIQVDGLVKVGKTDRGLAVSVESKEAAILIGVEGEALQAFQHILRVISQKHLDEFVGITVDVEGYRQRRNVFLLKLADEIAQRVELIGKPEALKPMGASDRRVVHMRIKELNGVVSESIGEGSDRKVVIKPIMKKIW